MAAHYDQLFFERQATRRRPWVWGDYLDVTPSGVRARARIEADADAVAAAGGSFEFIDLPAMGIAGNAHFPMMDDNSEQVAALVQDWMDQKNLMA